MSDPTAPFASDGTPGPDGRRVGVLLSHGFTGSPASIRPWAEHLAALGYAVRVPLLPGHGTTWQQMNRTGWGDWSGAIEQAYADLSAQCDRVVVGGLSMGGTLALWLASRHPEIAGVVVVNPAVASTNRQLLALPLLKYVVPSMPGLANDIKKAGVAEHGYDRTPLRALASLVDAWKALRPDLPAITAPLLVFRSAEDHVVDPSSARIILQRVSSRDAREILLPDSYHVATLDNDAPTIFAESARFVERVTAP